MYHDPKKELVRIIRKITGSSVPAGLTKGHCKRPISFIIGLQFSPVTIDGNLFAASSASKLAIVIQMGDFCHYRTLNRFTKFGLNGRRLTLTLPLNAYVLRR